MSEAFGKYVNSACMERGKQLVKEAKEEHNKRKEASDKDVEQAAKDIATGLVGIGKGRILTLPSYIKVKNIMSNADRRAMSLPEDPDLEDYQGGKTCI